MCSDLETLFVQKMSTQLENKKPFQHQWYVHSIFKNGLNLINENRLLFIGTDKNGSLPFALHLSFKDTKELLKVVEIGALFLYDSIADVFKYQTFVLSFEYTRLYNSELLKQQKLSLRQVEKVWVKTSEVIEYNGFQERLPLALKDTTSQAFRKAGVGLFSTETSKIRESLLFFIGRGVGLTPSGDDFLVGLLSVDSGFSLLDSHFRPILLDLLKSKERTTLVGTTYLYYAIEHMYSTTLLSFANELSTNHKGNQIKVDFKQILSNGSTSGLDTMTGILIGLEALKKENKVIN